MLNPNTVLKQASENPVVSALSSVIGRALLAFIFIIAGWGKLTAYQATQGYMEAMGVPGGLLPLTILMELGGGIAILLGLQTRLVALGLAGFSIVTALIFHSGAEDSINLMKNLAMSGGFIFLALHGAGKISLDALFEKS
ncbi:DoxX family protein [Acinetobacter sp. SwsAc6]|uniref:DoxX family protein n=1 Tax=Acinetobacter TaxID=469 RepID=UPI000E3562A1|nr:MULTISPECIES: DoxX family protein [Acinetobacter]NWK74444.1 DoxX family protein [Acinetobacter sp. SwsAc6]RFS29094.1 DoxX family protein [Acinetobacter sp. SWAC5]RKG47709.1 DoxX family membrane protein [Acinetobacter cumulans]